MESFERHIPFEGVFNFRDLGGYRTRDGRTVRWRRLFRSDELHLMTNAEVAEARGVLGLTTVIDLRDPKVVAQDGTGPLIKPPIAYPISR